jgi:predicted enzyme related to lactoylglutathione lyase
VIDGAHVIVHTANARALRDFFRDVLELPWVDAGDGWPIFALPPAEVAAHPVDTGAPANGAARDGPHGPKDPSRHELYLTCDDIEATVSELTAKGVEFAGPVVDRGWGLLTAIRLPGGGELGLYEPRHPRQAAHSS